METPANFEGTYISPCQNAALTQRPSYIVVGYGNGEALGEAKSRALQDIAETVSASVKSSSKGHSQKSGMKTSRSFQEEFEISAKVQISNAVRECLDQNDPSGLIHVAYKIDQRPPLSILSNKILGRWNGATPETINWHGPSALTNSSAAKQLEHNLTKNPVAGQTQTLSMSLYRKNGQWYLEVETEYVQIPEEMLGSLLHWSSTNNSPARVEMVKFNSDHPKGKKSNRYLEGDEFRFRVKTSMEEPFYLTPFNVYPDGRIAQMTDSVEISGDTMFPATGIFSAALLEPGKSVKDVYIFIISKSSINNVQFEKLRPDSGIASGDNSYQLDEFVKWIDTLDMVSIVSQEALVNPR